MSRRKREAPKPREVDAKQLSSILDRARQGVLAAEEVDTLQAAVDTLSVLTHEIEQAGVTITRLRHLLFGARSEKTAEVLNKSDPESVAKDLLAKSKSKSKRPGHGRRGASEYVGAKQVVCAHDTLKAGQRCPACHKGKLYPYRPTELIRVTGIAPLSATCYRLERLRCNLCGQLFKADPPAGIGTRKYDDRAAAMLILLRYGCGLPHNRMARLGENLGMPMPIGTQWDVVAKAAKSFEGVWAHLIECAADAELIHIDDTYAQVLALNEAIAEEIRTGQQSRTGIFTSGVVARRDGRTMTLFFTSRQHAGENLDKVLKMRSAARPPPIQMGDALSRNTTPGEFATILANCMAHARRQFVDLAANFPDEVTQVLQILGEVYGHDQHCRTSGLSDAQRLGYHQQHSGPLMKKLKSWMKTLLKEHKVEPNSGLGSAFAYLDNHWQALTCFLRVPGAPLDNNICERALKRAIVHRRNSLFYRTENGAHIGDVFMSLIYTAEQCGANPFDYLIAILQNSEAATAHPENWMPWNYTQSSNDPSGDADDPTTAAESDRDVETSPD